MESENQNGGGKEITKGFFLIAGINILVSIIGIVFYPFILAIGLVQLLYVVPLAMNASKKNQKNVMKGMIIASSVTFLLNASCYGLFFGLMQSP